MTETGDAATIVSQWNGFGSVSVLIAGVEVYSWQDHGHNDEAWCRREALRAFAGRLAAVLREDADA